MHNLLMDMAPCTPCVPARDTLLHLHCMTLLIKPVSQLHPSPFRCYYSFKIWWV